jgi:hypothetical protein
LWELKVFVGSRINMPPIQTVKMGRFGQLGRQKRRKFKSTSILVITRGKREFRTCWPSFPALVFGHSFLGVLLLGVLFLDPRSWTLVFEVGGTRGHAIAWRHIHVEGWMKKKDLKKSCYGPKGDRKVEVLRICLG